MAKFNVGDYVLVKYLPNHYDNEYPFYDFFTTIDLIDDQIWVLSRDSDLEPVKINNLTKVNVDFYKELKCSCGWFHNNKCERFVEHPAIFEPKFHEITNE